MAQDSEHAAVGALPCGRGVYYARVCAPGVLLRLLVSLIDGGAMVLVLIACGAVGGHIPRAWWPVYVATVMLVQWAYMVPLKNSQLGTAGYALFRLKVVDLRGERPSLLRMTFRLVAGVAINPYLDVIWSASDDSHQAMRDKLSGTYVVRRRCVPAGTGAIVRARLFLLMLPLLYREVARGPESTDATRV